MIVRLEPWPAGPVTSESPSDRLSATRNNVLPSRTVSRHSVCRVTWQCWRSLGPPERLSLRHLVTG